MGENDVDRLESWKEIAGFIGRSERTAMRWAQRRGMPVRQIPGGKGAGVYASRSEIDAWMGKHPKPESEPEAEDSLPESSARIRSRWVWASAALVAGLILAVVLIASSRHAFGRGIPSHVKFMDNGFVVVDETLHEFWTHTFAKRLYPEAFAHGHSMEELVRIDDFRGDGGREVLVVAPLHVDANSDGAFQVEIDFFSSRGDLLWSYIPKKTLQFGDHILEGPWNITDIFVSSREQKKTIWVSAIHYIWGNSFVSQLDPENGSETVRFVNTGIVYHVNEMKTSRGTFLLAAGFNNEYDSGSLAIINEDKPSAVSPQTAGTRHKCVNCQEGAPDYYFVFPRSEINRIEKVYEDPVRRLSVTGQGIEVYKYELRNVEGVETYYSLRTEPTIEPVSLRYGSDYDMMHRDLSAQKKLDHSLENCPERLHPKPVRMWTPAGGWIELAFKPSKATD
jgi:hypothetical protein